MAEVERVLGQAHRGAPLVHLYHDRRTGANAERLGVSIRELVHYQMVTASETRYYTFWLTADGHVVDFTSYSD